MIESTPSPQLEFALELRVNIGSVLEVGPGPFGRRRTVPITGGVFRGPAICGCVLPGGADWQFVDDDGLTLLDARYVIETEDGVWAELRNQGIRHGAREVMNRIAAGESVLSNHYYFRTTPRFFPPKEVTSGSRSRYSSEMLSAMPS